MRLVKLIQMIGECRYGVHDLSRTTLDAASRLPRFNMPLELGIFLGAKAFGRATHRQKTALILDRDPFRYQKFCSDIAGQDIRAHNNATEDAVQVLRNWLNAARPTVRIPGGARIASRYLTFRVQLPRMCHAAGLEIADLTFVDYRTLVVGWLDENPF